MLEATKGKKWKGSERVTWFQAFEKASQMGLSRKEIWEKRYGGKGRKGKGGGGGGCVATDKVPQKQVKTQAKKTLGGKCQSEGPWGVPQGKLF